MKNEREKTKMKNEKCLHLIGPTLDVSQKENSLRTPSFQTEWLAQFWWFLWKYQCMTLYVSIKIIVKRVDSCFASFIFRLSWVTEFAMIVSVDISKNVFKMLLNILMNIPMNMSKIVDSCFPDWVTCWLNFSLFMMGE